MSPTDRLHYVQILMTMLSYPGVNPVEVLKQIRKIQIRPTTHTGPHEYHMILTQIGSKVLVSYQCRCGKSLN